MKEEKKKGLLLVMSGPSGVGKGTICKYLTTVFPMLRLSISATTRSPRKGEIDGVHYYFIEKKAFEDGIKADQFLEYEPVFENYYGTPKEYVEKQRLSGYDILLEIDVKGAMQVKEKADDAVLIFIVPPSVGELKKRFISRGTESDDQIALRLSKAKEEIAFAEKYDYVVVNDDLEAACETVKGIISAEHHRIDQMSNYVKNLMEDDNV